jgi:hypothetical protein
MALFNIEWKLDREKSLFSALQDPPTETRFYEELKNGYKLTVRGGSGENAYEWGYTAFYDGQDHPVYGRDDVDAIEPYKVNDQITIGFFKKNGIYGGPYARKESLDGRELTVQTVGRSADGSVFFDVREYKA